MAPILLQQLLDDCKSALSSLICTDPTCDCSGNDCYKNLVKQINQAIKDLNK